MFRIDSAGSVGVLPAAGAAGTPGYFQDTTSPDTVVTADWLNGVQEEMIGVVVAAGITPEKGVNTQLLTAIQDLISTAIAAIPAAPSGSPGDIKMTGAAAAPAGWMLCQGAAVSRTTYAALYAAIGTAFGAGDGSTTFNLPDFRGVFPRGFDAGAGVDPARVLGSSQADQIKTHQHLTYGDANAGATWGTAGGSNVTGASGSDTDQVASLSSNGANPDGITGATPNTVGALGAETRPKNLAVNFIIKT